jgi:ATP-dependent RNA helicase RhlE
VPENLKTALLHHLLRHMDMPSVLVFTRTKHSAKRLTRAIAADGFAVAELHGNLTQAQRNRAMDGFRSGDFQVLVATNLASRGLDVEHITHVISFDVPDVPDDYVHRIGRTARAKAEGDAFILVSRAEEQSLADIERHIGQRLPRVTLPDFDYGQVAPERRDKPDRRPQGQRAAQSPPSGHRNAGTQPSRPERPGNSGRPRSRRRR